MLSCVWYMKAFCYFLFCKLICHEILWDNKRIRFTPGWMVTGEELAWPWVRQWHVSAFHPNCFWWSMLNDTEEKACQLISCIPCAKAMLICSITETKSGTAAAIGATTCFDNPLPFTKAVQFLKRSNEWAQ